MLMVKLFMVAFLAIFCFLFVLNSYLRGAAKQLITVIIGFAIFGTIAVSFFVAGWKFGLIMVFINYFLLFISHPFAKSLACKILGYRVGGGDEDRDGSFLKEFSNIRSDKDFETVMGRASKKDGARNARLESFTRNKSIASVLQKFNISVKEYQELFHFLWISAFQDLAWEIISSPTDLEELIVMKKEGKTDAEIWSYFRKAQ